MTYEYMCTDCGHAWEAEQPISEAPLRTCPSCQHDTAKRQVSGGAGFILKGGGWYADLYSSSGSSGKKSGGEGSGDSGSGKSDAGTKSSDSGTSTTGGSGSTGGSTDKPTGSTTEKKGSAASSAA
jgi:putative FmdB family regulatory protein